MSEAESNAPAAPAGNGANLSIRRFRFEAIILALLLLTLAAVEFQDLFLSRTIALRPDTIARASTYTYDDKPLGGHSNATMDPSHILRWSCDLRPGYSYPFCGYALSFDPRSNGHGIDLSRFQHVTLKLRYSGPGPLVRMSLRNDDPRRWREPDGSMPSEMNFPVTQGEQTLRLNLDDLGMPVWWAVQHHVLSTVRQPPRDNVVTLELQPGRNARNGHYEFAVESIMLEGRHFSPAQFYLGLLASWTMLVILFLAWRVLRIRRDYEQRHALHLQEGRYLAQAKAAAETANAAKSAFLANMTHELRTPLNAMLGYCQLLERDPLTERQRGAARTIQQSGNHLLTLIGDLLDLSKIEAGRVDLAPAAFDLKACIDGVAEMMRIRAVEKGLDFLAAIGADVPRSIVGDEKRLRQVLINLVGNAIRFTAAGQVSLLVSSPPPLGDLVRLRIEVADTGIGIAESKLPRVFERFEQAADAERASGGTGLGLTISQQIVALMGGRIEVESRVGSGTRFWFEVELPLADQPLVTAGDGLRRRGLIVSADAAQRISLIGLLREMGCEIDEAADAGEAIAAAESCRPDFVLIDLDPAGCDALVVRFRAISGLRDLPLLVLSPAEPEADQSLRATGIDHVYRTPHSRAELICVLADTLGLATRRIVAAASEEPAEMVPPPPGDLDALLELARAGNMRAIRGFADQLAERGARFAPFAARLKTLADAYQSPAILDLVSRHANAREVAE